MPRKLRIPLRRRRPPELDKLTRRLLARGQDFFKQYRLRDRRGLDLERVRELWEALRDEFLAEWIQGHPGHRPWAWWKFDAPDEGRRERTDGQPHPFDRADYRAPRQLSSGAPRNWCTPDDARAVYESELEYLTRHDLLYAGEADRAAKLGAAASPHRLKIDPNTPTPAVSGDDDEE